MKNRYLYLIVSILYAGSLLAQESPVKTMIDTFQDYAENHPVEKIYLQLDKPYYAAGETMYFRAYLTDMDLSPENAASKIIYIELSDAKKNLIKRSLLYSEQQEFAGQLQLSDSLPSAEYHLRAYTNWMRNAGEDYFYHRDIYIGNTNGPKPGVATSQAFDYQVSFFPEGGQLLAGLTNKVAFKALGNDGFGAEVSGILSDSEGKELLKFNSSHFGMGSFNFTPEKGKTYKVSVQSNVITKEYTLPAATEGLALSARQDENSVYLTIRSTELKQDSIYIIGQSRNTVCYALEGLTKGYEQKIVVDKTNFPAGIAQFTLFKNGLPVSERLLFIDRKDDLHVIIYPDKDKYEDREKALVRIRVTDNSGKPVEGSFSLSVTDDRTVKPSLNEQNIKGGLLLDSDLKGYVESPGWYFAGNEPERAEALDNLLCTQGWSRFEWEKITPPASPISYPVESDFKITGKITSESGKPVHSMVVQLLSKNIILGTAITDETGGFGFIGFSCPEGTELTLQSPIKNNQKISLDEVDNRQTQINIIPLFRNTNSNEAFNYMAQAGHSSKVQNERTYNLPEVVIKKEKKTQDRSFGIRSYHFDETALNKNATIGRVIQSFPKPSKGPQSFNAIVPPVWYIVNDGMKIDLPTFLSMYGQMNANRFESVDVLCPEDAVTLYGLEFSSGAYKIKTKDNMEDIKEQASNSSTKYYRPEGYCVRKEFYVPAYDKPEVRNDSTPDLRTTIYWNPVIRTDNEGRAQVSFYTADKTGSYSYVLEGIGDDKVGFIKK